MKVLLVETDLAARKRLGTAVRQARRRAGFSKTAEWVDKVGRSDRILLGLERGESAGADTYAAVAEALGWSLDRLYGILSGEPVESPSGSAELTAVSDEELAAEVLRRMKAGVTDDREKPTNVSEMTKRERMQQVPSKAAQKKPSSES